MNESITGVTYAVVLHLCGPLESGNGFDAICLGWEL